MASTAPLQCLFCKHLNPAGASFCNECGSQLNLQPCDQCDAIDNRAAKNCYKCGAEFNFPAAPESDPVIAPEILGQQVSDPPLNVAAGAGPENVHPNHDPAHSPLEFQPVNETAASQIAATGTRRGWLVAVAALLLALIAIPAYFHDGQPAKLPPKQDAKPLGPGVSGAPKPGGNTLSSAGATLTERPLPATDGDVKSPQDRPIFKECPQAVATLGLCSPGK